MRSPRRRSATTVGVAGMTLRLITAQGGPGGPAEGMSLSCSRYEIAEWTFRTEKSRADPFGQVTLDATINGPRGRTYKVPAFWAGGDLWRVRFAPPDVGRYTLRTVCSDHDDHGLHARCGELGVTPYFGENPLLRHGLLGVTADERHLAHADGTPFFWLGDTWWLGLTQRLAWPDGFKTLVANRRAKGFTVIQLLAGLFCDMPAHDERGSNEGGLVWKEGYSRINPAFFDWADLRIDWLVAEGLVPCLFGSWSFHLLWMGVERIKQHWRYLVARYGAYPIIWCLAGGGTMPYYLSGDREGDREIMRKGWDEVAGYIRAIDLYKHPIALHPTPLYEDLGESGTDVRPVVPMRRVHGLAQQLRGHRGALESQPESPTLDFEGQVCFPGMLLAEDHELHRILFWICALSGASGYTYGVNGIWQFNAPSQSFGPSPTGRSWPNTHWNEAMRLASAAQVGWGRELMDGLRWWEFRSHPEWIEPHAHTQGLRCPYAAGIPSDVRVIYFPQRLDGPAEVRGIEPGLSYRARFVNPRNGDVVSLGSTNGQSTWPVPPLPDEQDWLLIMERAAP